MPKSYQATKNTGWAQYPTIASSNTALVVGSRKAANIPANVIEVSEQMNNMEIRAKATGNENVTGTLHVYGCRNLVDDISHIGDVEITAGQQIATDSNRYIDTMTLTDRWITEVKLADHKANNGMSRLVFDTSGYGIVFFLITYSDSTDWIIEYSGFN
jgi:superfamily I DNA/RNA helicase